MKRRAFLKSYVLGSAGLFVPSVLRGQAFTFFDPQVYRAKPFGINPIVTAWAARVVSNGGSNPSLGTQTAMSHFVDALQAASIWAKMITVNCFVPDGAGISLIAALTPLLVGSGGNDPWTNGGVAFVAADLSVNGLTGSNAGGGKALKTGITHTVIGPSAAGISWYAKFVTTQGFNAGGYDGTWGLMHAAKHSDGKSYAYNGSIASNAIVVNPSPGAGFYSDLRVSATDHKLYFANSGNAFAQIGVTDATNYGGTAFAGTMWTHAENLSAGIQFPASDTLSFIAYHNALTASEASTLFDKVQAMRTAFGGGFV